MISTKLVQEVVEDYNNNFSLLHTKIRSLNQNFESLDNLLSIDIIGLSELWLP